MNQPSQQAKCNQCDRGAMYNSNGVPLCLQCFTQVKALLQQEMENQMIAANMALDEIDAILPFGRLPGRFIIPRRVRIEGPAMTNIRISNSTIGVVNTGTVNRIDASVNTIRQAGYEEIARAITALTEGVANTKEMSDEARQTSLEALSAIAQEAGSEPGERRNSVVKTMIGSLATSLQTVAATADLWQTVGPTITAFFGF